MWTCTSMLLFYLTFVAGQVEYYSTNTPMYGYYNIPQTGDPCTLPLRPPGICAPLNQCREVVTQSQMPVLCSYQNFSPIVCCPSDKIITAQPTVAAAPAALTQKTASDQEPIFSAVGTRSRRACEQYFTLLQGQAKKSPARTDGVQVQPSERPHMALIGFGKKHKILWRCSGSLISPNFVLAPGHCLASRRHGAVKWVMLGVVDPYDASLSGHPQLFSIAERKAVPGFSPPSLHHDLSLLRLDRDAEFSEHVRPACLGPRRPPLGKAGSVPGWELVNWIIEPGRSRLMEVTLEVLPDSACGDAYKGNFRLDGHYSGEHLLCVGNHKMMTTNCERDTGGPFHIQTPDNLFIISGVVLFGNTVCERRNNTPVITTDVASYLPWIEDTVWPVEGTAQRTNQPEYAPPVTT